MEDELELLINTFLDDKIRCVGCNTNIDIQETDLEHQTDQLYTTRYNCSGDNCDIKYDIQVEDQDSILYFEANERGTDRSDKTEDIIIKKSRQKFFLRHESLPKIDDAVCALLDAIEILYHNKQQLQNAQEIIKDRGGTDRDGDLHRRIRADTHNYMAAAYSFEEIFTNNVEPHIPGDSPINDAKTEFKDENEVIKALRTYTQHHLTLPSSIRYSLESTSEDSEIAIVVPMDDLSDFQPGDPEASFEPVKGNHIRVVDRTNRHYQAANNLVNTVLEGAKQEYSNRVEEY